MNAKEEFISKIGTKDIKYAVVAYDPHGEHDFVDNKGVVNSKAVAAGLEYFKYDLKHPISVLKEGYTEADLNTFLNTLNYDYDEDYGRQELFGIVFMKDGSWWTRAEYDGSEWWTKNTVPDIPECCK